MEARTDEMKFWGFSSSLKKQKQKTKNVVKQQNFGYLEGIDAVLVLVGSLESRLSSSKVEHLLPQLNPMAQL